MNKSNFAKSVQLFNNAILARVFHQTLVEISQEKLTAVQVSCIRFVHLHSEPSVGAIADGLAISNAASAKLVDRLVRKKFLTREEDQKDRRVLKIKLTPSGKQLLQEILDRESELFQRILARMTPETVEALRSGIVGFLQAALEAPGQIDEVCLHCGVEHTPDCIGNLLYRELTGNDKKQV